MSKKYVMLDAHKQPEADFHQEKELLEANGYECVIAHCETEEEVLNVARDADMIGDVCIDIDENIISQLEKCTAIIRYGIGYDLVDVNAASKKGIAVYNLPTYCIEDVATHALALMMGMIRKISMYDADMRKGNWRSTYGYRMHRLKTLTLGLIGFGNTAQVLAGYAKGIGMHIIASDPFQNEEIFRKTGVEKVDYDELYRRADIISIHMPLTEKTKHFVNKEMIDKLKDGVMLINTSRGGIIDLDALMDAVEVGKIFAAGLDVFEEEPFHSTGSRILDIPNIIMTPHIAYLSEESSDEQHRQAAETVLEVFRGNHPTNIVNKKQLENVREGKRLL